MALKLEKDMPAVFTRKLIELLSTYLPYGSRPSGNAEAAGLILAGRVFGPHVQFFDGRWYRVYHQPLGRALKIFLRAPISDKRQAIAWDAI